MTSSGRDRSLGHYDAPPSFKNDLDMLDRYQAFSTEILRVSLLGLSGLGILIFNSFLAKNVSVGPVVDQPLVARVAIIFAATLFGISAAAALLHRYCSADSTTCQLRVLRLEIAERDATAQRKERDCMLAWSNRMIQIGVVSLAFGGLGFVVAIAAVVFQ